MVSPFFLHCVSNEPTVNNGAYSRNLHSSDQSGDGMETVKDTLSVQLGSLSSLRPYSSSIDRGMALLFALVANYTSNLILFSLISFGE